MIRNSSEISLMDQPIRDAEKMFIFSCFTAVKGKDYPPNRMSFNDFLSLLILTRHMLPDCQENSEDFLKAREDISNALEIGKDSKTHKFKNIQELRLNQKLDTNTKYNFLVAYFLLCFFNDNEQGEYYFYEKI